MSLVSEILALLNEAEVDDQVRWVVLASIQGEEELEAVLEGNIDGLDFDEAAVVVDGQSAYLESIEVSGFRGIGSKTTMELAPGPGLTVVAGRNGSGKSSFADALEVLLTGDSWRWKDKAAEWKRGWRNLHDGEAPRVAANFELEGHRGSTEMWREWDDTAKEAAQGETMVQPPGEKRTTLDGIGWTNALDVYRPLLSHSELGVVASNPSSLFDALTGVLGVERLVNAAELLRRRRLELEKPLKEAKKELKDNLLPSLQSVEDERAGKAIDAVTARTWDLDAVGQVAAGAGSPDPQVRALRTIAEAEGPELDAVSELASRLESAISVVAQLEDAEAGRAARVALLLQQALHEHEDHGDMPCPVCGEGQLDASWRQRTEAELEKLNEAASAYREAVGARDTAAQEVRRVVNARALSIDKVDLDTSEYESAVSRWRDLPEDVSAWPGHLRSQVGDVASAVGDLKKWAAAEVAERESEWTPVAVSLASWVELARRGQYDDVLAKQLKRAEAALVHATEQIRADRFDPISKQAIALWERLRLQSNVHLNEIALVGKGSRRRVDLNVTVDDADTAALGVVSQGEVNCLALSLFFPRVMLDESPFRFIVIDDPIQAMDPARVDGLAQVFADVAKERQLVVFTHDDRLPEALRRLGLPHTLLQVTRRPGSVVQVEKAHDPVVQYFLDARVVAKDEELSDLVASRVVPGFCRNGIEAACVEAVRRRRIGRGESHQSVEDAVVGRKTMELAALALFDDENQGGQVLAEINKRWDRRAGNAFRDCQKGAHQGFGGSLLDLTHESQRLAEGLRALP